MHHDSDLLIEQPLPVEAMALVAYRNDEGLKGCLREVPGNRTTSVTPFCFICRMTVSGLSAAVAASFNLVSPAAFVGSVVRS